MSVSATRTLEAYLSLPYTIEVVPDKKQGGWYIWIRELPGCMTQADRWEDVLPMIEEAQRLWLEASLERGYSIPEPASSQAVFA